MRISITCKLLLLLAGLFLLPTASSAGPTMNCYDTFAPEEDDEKVFKRRFNRSKRMCFSGPADEKRATFLTPSTAKSFTISIEQSDFERHLAVGMSRSLQGIDENQAFAMDVQNDEPNQVWTIPDLRTFASYETRTMRSIAPENTPYYLEEFPDATHAFSIDGFDLYSYYRVGEVDFADGPKDVVFYYGDVDATNTDNAAYIESDIPLRLDAGKYGGSNIFNCADFDDEPCSDYPTAVTHEERQTYTPLAEGMLDLYDDGLVPAIKLFLVDEIFYYDQFGDEVGYEFDYYYSWYSEDGHYVIAALEDGAPLTGQTEFHIMEYQKITTNSLPIQWVDFSAKVTPQQAVKLHWQTAVELDNNRFIIQKGTDGQSFTKIGEQTAKGNDGTPQTYDFIDKKPIVGTNYYRIQQIDNDGKSTFSEVITAIIADDENDEPIIVLYPNPGKDEVWFSQPADYELFDAAGNLLNSGKADGALDVSRIPAGTYFVRINGGSMQSWLKN